MRESPRTSSKESPDRQSIESQIEKEGSELQETVAELQENLARIEKENGSDATHAAIIEAVNAAGRIGALLRKKSQEKKLNTQG